MIIDYFWLFIQVDVIAINFTRLIGFDGQTMSELFKKMGIWNSQ